MAFVYFIYISISFFYLYFYFLSISISFLFLFPFATEVAEDLRGPTSPQTPCKDSCPLSNSQRHIRTNLKTSVKSDCEWAVRGKGCAPSALRVVRVGGLVCTEWRPLSERAADRPPKSAGVLQTGRPRLDLLWGLLWEPLEPRWGLHSDWPWELGSDRVWGSASGSACPRAQHHLRSPRGKQPGAALGSATT